MTVVRAWADLALRSALGAALAIFLQLAVLPRTGLYRTETVLSGSMKPDFNSGDLVIVTKGELTGITGGTNALTILRVPKD